MTLVPELTLLAVHAHPDDEAIGTGGILARSSAEGIQTVVVTCTNGELGDGPGGVKPGTEGHDEAQVVATRTAELEESCRLLGVTHLERLGYRDSGMVEWDYKQRPDAFCNVPVEEAAAQLVKLFELYRPDVVVTYEPDAAYDHPDHVHAARATLAASELSGIPKKLYYTAFSLKGWDEIRSALEQRGVEMPPMPDFSEEVIQRMQESARRITTTVDVAGVVDRKLAAAKAHASQLDQSFFTRLPPDLFRMAFGEESFIRSHDTTGAPLLETDLFAGLR